MTGEKPTAEYCPTVEGFCSALVCSSCINLHREYETDGILWLCLKCQNKDLSAYRIISYTCVTKCESCGIVSLVCAHTLKLGED
jgi:hypothetical protein